MDIADFLVAKREEIMEVAARHGARNVRVFGSVARGEATPDSDVDLLVDIDPNYAWSTLIDISHELEQLLGRKVDVSTERSLRPRVRQRALEEAIPLGASHSMNRAARDVSRMRRDRDRLLDIVEAIDTIQKYVPNTGALEEYPAQAVVLLNVQTIGEAASRLSNQFRQQHVEVPWTQIIAMRNELVHGYWKIDIEKVKPVIESGLSDLRMQIQSILNTLDFSE